MGVKSILINFDDVFSSRYLACKRLKNTVFTKEKQPKYNVKSNFNNNDRAKVDQDKPSYS
jgi:hypothetical protein